MGKTHIISASGEKITLKQLDAVRQVTDMGLKKLRRQGDARKIQLAEYALEQADKSRYPNIDYALQLGNLRYAPVTIGEFLDSEEFLGHDPDFKIWPSLRRDIEIINADIFTGGSKPLEAMDGGATGTGKTFVATITQAYQLYCLLCFKKPQKLWPILGPKTPLIFMFQSVQEGITRRVIYEPFREMFCDMPFTQRWLKWNKEKEYALEFDTNIRVIPALANIQKMLGQAIVSCILDEVNFMSVVQESKKEVGPRGQGGLYDQAEIVYNNIVRRRKGRMHTVGPDPGVISVLSSTRYLGDFLDRRVKEVKSNKEEDVHVMRRMQFEAQPGGNAGPKIKILVGSVEYGTRILRDDEIPGKHYPVKATVIEVPKRYESQFRRDPEGSLRDVCGIATDVISPYITQRHKIIEAIVRGTKLGLKPWVQKSDVELDTDGMPQIVEQNLPPIADRNRPRFVHIDLARTKDRCGIAIVKVIGMEAIADPKSGIVEYLPHYVLEQGISIKPSKANEINIPDIRQWVLSLKEYYGINIHTVSYDGFDSQESMQILRKQGILSWNVSMDKTTGPYDSLKAALYSDRFDMQDHELLKIELAGLEYHAEKDKVDHSPHLSKDLADAVAGAVYSAGQNRTVRAQTGASRQDGQQNEHTLERSRVQRSRSPHRRVRR